MIISRHSITIGSIIGWGTFGVVSRGTYLNEDVAVKTVPLPDTKTKELTLKEAQIHRLFLTFFALLFIHIPCL